MLATMYLVRCSRCRRLMRSHRSTGSRSVRRRRPPSPLHWDQRVVKRHWTHVPVQPHVAAGAQHERHDLDYHNHKEGRVEAFCNVADWRSAARFDERIVAVGQHRA